MFDAIDNVFTNATIDDTEISVSQTKNMNIVAYSAHSSIKTYWIKLQKNESQLKYYRNQKY